MVLLPNVPFSNGDVVTPDILDLAFNQVYDDQPEYLGHHPRITDSQLSVSSGQLLDRVSKMRDPFLVSVVSGLTLNHKTGILYGSQGNVITIPAANFTVPDNQTTFVYLKLDGTIAQSTSLPSVTQPLAKVVTSGGAVTTLTDLRDIGARSVGVDPGYALVFGGQADIDKVCTNGETLNQGLYYFRDFTVPSGITINISGSAIIKCSGQVLIEGTVNVTTLAQGADTIQLPSISGYLALRPGIGLGTNGTTLVGWGTQPYGSAANSGAISGNVASGNFSSGGGGAGGGGLRIEAARGVDVYGSILAKGGNGATSTVTTGAVVLSGAGGGSGGCVILASPAFVTLRPGSTVDVRGGNGANAVAGAGAPSQGGGGGGGAGGVLVLFAPTGQANTTGANILLTGGTGGTALGAVSGVSGARGASFMTAGGAENATTSQNNTGGLGTIILLPYTPLG